MPDMILLNPPLCEPTVPLLGPYQLAGFAQGIDFNLKILDFNLEFIRYILDIAKKPFDKEINDRKIDFEINVCRHFLDSYSFSNYADVLHSIRACSSVQEYWSIIDYIRACYDLFSLRFSDLRFRLDGFDTKYRWNIWTDIKQFVREYVNSNLFELLDNWVVKYHVWDTPKQIIGISITFESQLFFAILLCIAIRRHCPDAFIVIGGGFVNSFINSCDSIGPLDEYCDLVVSGEGEALLWELKEIDTQNVHDLKKRGTFSGKRAYYATASNLCDKKLRVSLPCFDDCNLSMYPSPSRVIPLRFTYQCYWGKCKFCSDKEPHNCFESQYDFNDVVNYCVQNNDFDCIYFLDSAIPPKLLEKLCDALIHSKKRIYWGTNLRADKPFISEEFIKKLALSGCVFIKFGLESGSQRVLNLMNKGTEVNDAARFIYLCRKYNIYVHSYIMFAYPGETKQDRDKTREFLLSEYSHPDNYNCSEFILYGKAPIAKELQYDFKEDYTEEGWHSASYSFTNETIKQEISSLRQEFDSKYAPKNVLVSTGHTIAFSRRMKDVNMGTILLFSDTILSLSPSVVEDRFGKDDILGTWHRRDGIVFIKGNDVRLVLDYINNKTVQKILSSGVTSNTLFDLLNARFLHAEYISKKQTISFTGDHQIHLHYGMELTKIHWYGFYDAN